MRLLYTHVDHIYWKVRRKSKVEPRDELTEDNRERRIENALVITFAVESADFDDTARRVAADIDDVCSKVKAEAVVLYPFVHLFPDELASPQECMRLRDLISGLVSRPCYHVPFGWYKVHEYRSPGHPLAELSRTFR